VKGKIHSAQTRSEKLKRETNGAGRGALLRSWRSCLPSKVDILEEISGASEARRGLPTCMEIGIALHSRGLQVVCLFLD